jgi:hypothetical protein
MAISTNSTVTVITYAINDCRAIIDSIIALSSIRIYKGFAQSLFS